MTTYSHITYDDTTTDTITFPTGAVGASGPYGSMLNYGSNGSVFTATSSSYVWAMPATSMSNASGKEVLSIPPNEATVDVKGRVRIQGEYLDERLERIETLLNIPTRDVEMENEFPRLKKLWEEYNNELEKYKTWKRLNK